MKGTRLRVWNASIAAGSAFFGALVGVVAAGIFPEGLWAAFVAAGVAFFGALSTNNGGTEEGGPAPPD